MEEWNSFLNGIRWSVIENRNEVGQVAICQSAEKSQM